MAGKGLKNKTKQKTKQNSNSNSTEPHSCSVRDGVRSWPSRTSHQLDLWKDQGNMLSLTTLPDFNVFTNQPVVRSHENYFQISLCVRISQLYSPKNNFQILLCARQLYSHKNNFLILLCARFYQLHSQGFKVSRFQGFIELLSCK